MGPAVAEVSNVSLLGHPLIFPGMCPCWGIPCHFQHAPSLSGDSSQPESTMGVLGVTLPGSGSAGSTEHGGHRAAAAAVAPGLPPSPEPSGDRGRGQGPLCPRCPPAAVPLGPAMGAGASGLRWEAARRGLRLKRGAVSSKPSPSLISKRRGAEMKGEQHRLRSEQPAR